MRLDGEDDDAALTYLVDEIHVARGRLDAKILRDLLGVCRIRFAHEDLFTRK